MKVRDLIKLMEKDGWVLKNQAGSHRHRKDYYEAGRYYGMKYAVVFEQGPMSVGAVVPDLPGCFAIGPNMSETRKLVAEAIEFHIQCLREAGDSVPEPSHHAEDVEVAV